MFKIYVNDNWYIIWIHILLDLNYIANHKGILFNSLVPTDAIWSEILVTIGSGNGLCLIGTKS